MLRLTIHLLKYKNMYGKKLKLAAFTLFKIMDHSQTEQYIYQGIPILTQQTDNTKTDTLVGHPKIIQGLSTDALLRTIREYVRNADSELELSIIYPNPETKKMENLRIPVDVIMRGQLAARMKPALKYWTNAQYLTAITINKIYNTKHLLTSSGFEEDVVRDRELHKFTKDSFDKEPEEDKNVRGITQAFIRDEEHNSESSGHIQQDTVRKETGTISSSGD